MIYDRYYYSKLNNDEKLVYKQIYEGLDKVNKRVCISGVNLSARQIEQIFLYVNLDNPHLFYIDFTSMKYRQGFLGYEIVPSYLYLKKEICDIKNKINVVVNKILSKVKGNTEYEKELSLHDVLISNIVYDQASLSKPRTNSPKNNTIIGPLFFKSAVCEGISKVYKFLLNLLDIKCIVVVGKELKTNENHAWNIVKINNEPYYVDVTWDLDPLGYNCITHDYFNLTTIDFSKEHEVNTSFPICNYNNFNYYVKENLIVKTKNDINNIVRKTIINKNSHIEFKFLGKTTLENARNYAVSLLKFNKLKGFESKELNIVHIVLPNNNNQTKVSNITNTKSVAKNSKQIKKKSIILSFFSIIYHKIKSFFK